MLHFPKIGIESADVSWDESVPRQDMYDDCYFSKSDPVAESTFVFVEGSRLAAHLENSDAHPLVVSELGFGTGLNFLLTYRLWKQSRRRQLRYISFEKHPLSRVDLETALGSLTGISEEAPELLDAYPPMIHGWHRLKFKQPGIMLDLVFGDVIQTLPKTRFVADCWYLDGFKPSSNEQMWSDEVIREVKLRSRSTTTLSTFSAAGHVRRKLAEQGFIVNRQQGFGGKRHMLTAQMEQDELKTRRRLSADIMVVGGGVAGAAVALACARRGMQVTLVEGERLASGASGCLRAMVMPHLSATSDARTRLSLSCFSYFLQQIRSFADSGIWDACGVLRLSTSERLETVSKRLGELLVPDEIARNVTSEEASVLAGVAVRGEGIYFPTGGLISPSKFIKQLLKQAGSNVTVIEGEKVEGLSREGSRWEARRASRESITTAEAVVLTTGPDTSVDLIGWLPLEPVGGQLVYCSPTNESLKLRVPVCYDGYILPQSEGRHVVGATYDHGVGSTHLSEDRSDELYSKVTSYLPSVASLGETQAETWYGVRASTPDKLPVVGAIPDRKAFSKNYKPAKLKNWNFDSNSDSFLPQAYVSAGFGSHGVLMSLLMGELLASEINDEPLPVDSDLRLLLNPARFLARELNRQT